MDWQGAQGLVGMRWYPIIGGVAGFACFIIAMVLYPGGEYNPLLQMLSALGEVEVRGIRYPLCHYWFVAG